MCRKPGPTGNTVECVISSQIEQNRTEQEQSQKRECLKPIRDKRECTRKKKRKKQQSSQLFKSIHK